MVKTPTDRRVVGRVQVSVGHSADRRPDPEDSIRNTFEHSVKNTAVITKHLFVSQLFCPIRCFARAYNFHPPDSVAKKKNFLKLLLLFF